MEKYEKMVVLEKEGLPKPTESVMELLDFLENIEFSLDLSIPRYIKYRTWACPGDYLDYIRQLRSRIHGNYK